MNKAGFSPGSVSSGEHSVARLTVLLPALNEEEAIRHVIDSIPSEHLSELGYVAGVLVVDGNSTDATRRIARETGAQVVRQRGYGKGIGVRIGLDTSDGAKYLVMLDADGTYPAENIPAFVTALDKGADVVMGSRFRGKIERGAMSRMRQMGNRMLSFLATLLYGQKTTDVCTGMWAFNRNAVARLRLTSIGFEIEAELFAESVKRGLRIDEVPITYRQRQGESKLGSIPTGLKIGMKLVRKRFVP